ncbi:MAG TPA: glutathione S-transferase [Stellaceae bacterium]|nr:glutathione S-transferase [Stellaceae bacterium]
MPGEDAPILFHDPTSEPSRAVHWFALAAGIPLAVEHVWLTRDEHLGARFLEVNPRHQVPALQHGEFRLSEATAIIRYLAELNGAAVSWLGGSLRERAWVNQLLSWYHTNLRLRATLDYLLPVVLMPAYVAKAPPAAADVSDRRRRLGAALGEVSRFLGDAEFLGGSRPVVPDVLFASEISGLDADPERGSYADGLAALDGWLSRMRTFSGYEASHRPWNAVAAEVRTRLSARSVRTGSDPGWVAALGERAVANTD